MKDKAIVSDSRKAIKYRGPECLNCHHPLDLSDRFCPYCGQLNTTKRLSLKDFFGEFVLSFINYDSRFRYTVKDLLFKPGTITLNYVEGKRLKYANPFRFFLSVSIIYFLLTGFLNYFEPNMQSQYWGTDNFKIFNTDFEEDQAIPTDSLTTLDSTAVDSLQQKSALPSNYQPPEELEQLNFIKRTRKKFEIFSAFYKKSEIKSPRVALDSLKYDTSFTNRWLYERNEAIERAESNPLLFIQAVLSKIPFFIFFFTPLFALVFLLLYFKRIPFNEILRKLETTQNKTLHILINRIPILSVAIKYTIALFLKIFVVRRKINYMEHMIFIFHIFTFVFLVLLLVAIPDFLIGDDIFSALFIVFVGPFYFYKALRNFYKQRRAITIFKFFLLNIVFLFLAVSTGSIFFIVTAALY